MVTLKDALAVATNKRDNWGTPESIRSRFKVDINDMKNQKITVDKVIVVSKVAKDKAGVDICNKAGDLVYNQITFIAFGGDKYTVTKSALMAAQLDEIEPVIKNEPAEVAIPGLEGIECYIRFKSVRYADKKMYDQPYLSED